MILAIVASMLGLGQPIPGVDDARCFLDRLTAADEAEVAAAFSRGEAPAPATEERLSAIVVACAEELGWDPDRAASAAQLAIALILRDDSSARLAQAGIQAAEIDRWFLSQTAEFRASLQVRDADGERLVLELHRAGSPLDVLEANGETIGVYLGALILIERAERGLPLD